MATSNQELDSFLAKYKYLCSAGHKASLSFKSENFCTRISLDVELPFMTPPWSLPPPSCVQTPTMSPTSLRHRSPSYYRRLKRRYDARQKVEEDSNSIVDFGKKVEEAAMLPKVVENAAEDILSKEKIGTNSSDGAEMLTEENAAALDHVESECEVDEKGEADGKIKHVLDANTGSEYDGIKSSINDVSDDTPVVNGRGDCNGIGGLSGCVVHNDGKPAGANSRDRKCRVQVKDVQNLETDDHSSKNLDDDEFNCKLCGLLFESRQDLDNHNEAFTYCCWQCLTCYETLLEAQNCTC